MSKHKHIWKYTGNKRVCKAPFPTIESCGKVEDIPDTQDITKKQDSVSQKKSMYNNDTQEQEPKECMEDCCVQRREFSFSNKVEPKECSCVPSIHPKELLRPVVLDPDCPIHGQPKQDEWAEFDEKFVDEDDENCFGIVGKYISEDNPDKIKTFIKERFISKKELEKFEKLVSECSDCEAQGVPEMIKVHIHDLKSEIEK